MRSSAARWSAQREPKVHCSPTQLDFEEQLRQLTFGYSARMARQDPAALVRTSVT